jgi:hypothetical protein
MNKTLWKLTAIAAVEKKMAHFGDPIADHDRTSEPEVTISAVDGEGLLYDLVILILRLGEFGSSGGSWPVVSLVVLVG